MSPRDQLRDQLHAQGVMGVESIANRVDRGDHNLHRASMLMTATGMPLERAVALLARCGYLRPKVEAN